MVKITGCVCERCHRTWTDFISAQRLEPKSQCPSCRKKLIERCQQNRITHMGRMGRIRRILAWSVGIGVFVLFFHRIILSFFAPECWCYFISPFYSYYWLFGWEWPYPDIPNPEFLHQLVSAMVGLLLCAASYVTIIVGTSFLCSLIAGKRKTKQFSEL